MTAGAPIIVETCQPAGPPFRWLDLQTMGEFARDPLAFVSRAVSQYGPVVQLRLGIQPALLIADPTIVREVLVTKNRSFEKAPRAKRIIRNMAGAGTIASEGDIWFRHRRIIQKGFSSERMKKFAAVIVEHGRKRMQTWGDGTVVDVCAEMAELSLGIVAKSMLDLELTGEAARIHEWANTLSQAAVEEFSEIVPLPDWLPLPSKRRKRAAFRGLESLIQSVIAARRAAGDDRGDMLSILLSATDESEQANPLTDRQAMDEALTLLHAGYDSSAAGLAWTWYLLDQHPEIADAVQAEVADVLGDRAATLADYDRLEFCQQVVKESLRMYPPAWMMMVRRAVENVELSDFAVKRGTWIYVSPWATHRCERYFPNPTQFDPSRFSEQRISEIADGAFFPFGLGPHRCVGERLAMVEMLLALATVTQHCRLHLADPKQSVEVEMHTAIRPKGALRMRVELR
ncbi:MAG: cytochrome P450 [Planctomycetota bacterium]